MFWALEVDFHRILRRFGARRSISVVFYDGSMPWGSISIVFYEVWGPEARFPSYFKRFQALKIDFRRIIRRFGALEIDFRRSLRGYLLRRTRNGENARVFGSQISNTPKMTPSGCG